LAVLGILITGWCAVGSGTEDPLHQRVQGGQSEIKLANLTLAHVHDAYSQGHTEEGAKLLGTFIGEMKTAWKVLQDSGRKASRQSEGFRELEISLRENVRALQDLGRTVSYYDRAPLVDAEQELEQMRVEVLHALFPEGKPRTLKGSPPPQKATSPVSPTEER
jgi:hypothetical protein